MFATGTSTHYTCSTEKKICSFKIGLRVSDLFSKEICIGCQNISQLILTVLHRVPAGVEVLNSRHVERLQVFRRELKVKDVNVGSNPFQRRCLRKRHEALGTSQGHQSKEQERKIPAANSNAQAPGPPSCHTSSPSWSPGGHPFYALG